MQQRTTKTTRTCALRLLVLLSLVSQPGFAADVQISDSDLPHLSLQQAEQLFDSNSRELLAARRAMEGSQADTLSAAQKPNPTLSMGAASFNLNRRQANTNPNGSNSLGDQTINSSLQLSQLFERGNKRALRIAAADNALKAAGYDLKDTVRQQKLAMKAAYYDLLLAQQAEQVQENNAALYDKTLQAAELRLKAGDIASADAARIRVDALRSKNDLRQSQAERQKAQANLAYLIGKENEAAAIVATDNWPDIPPTAGTAAPDDGVINNRADIQAAAARTAQANENLKLAEALKTRDITVGLQYQHFPGQLPGAGDNTIGAAISIPLFTSYQYQGEIARAQVDYTAALEAREQIQAYAVGEIARARADLDAAIEKVHRFDGQILTEAQQAADAAEFAYQHGAMGVTDLLDARRILRALQLEEVSARADYAKSLAAWQAATKSETSQ